MDQAIREARARFRYIPDAPTLDEWDTVAEFERRGGGDCDGWTLWCLARAAALAPQEGLYWFLRGTMTTEKQTIGHAWAEIRKAERLWADPTWGWPCERPGRYSGRTPIRAYPMVGELMGMPTDYMPSSEP
jgi:hypothetical protein